MANDKNNPDSPVDSSSPTPGAVISPGAPAAPVGAAPAPPVQAEAAPPVAATKEVVAEQPVPSAEASPAEVEATPEPFAADYTDSVDEGEAISWSASEFIHHHKSTGWYVSVAAATLLVSIVMFMITKDFVSVAVVVVGAVLLSIYGSHQPRQLDYKVDQTGLSIGQKHQYYEEFKSFSVVPEGAFSSIVFMPLKRFGVPTTIYYPPEEEANIVAVLSSYLPFEESSKDLVDRLMHRIRF